MGPDPTKARLLEAAGEEFAEKGFEGATIRSICRRAGGLNIAAVNYHFGDKEQLYEQAVLESHRCAAGPPPDEAIFTGPPTEQLRHFVRHFLEQILALDDRESWQHTLMMRELLRPTRASEVLVREVIRPRFERLVAVLGRICPEAGPRRLHVLAFSVVGQCLHYKMARTVSERLIGPEEFAGLDVDYLTDHITAVMLAALGLAPPLNAAGEPAGAGNGEAPCSGSR